MRLLFIAVIACCLATCKSTSSSDTGTNTLLFSIRQERDVYDMSDYGEPPQFAIWLENQSTGDVRTVFVTRRTGTGDFEGKAECPVSLPAWVTAFRKETGRDDIPNAKKPAPDAVTGATPKEPEFTTSTLVPAGSEWNYYVEVNVSGDYTLEFQSLTSSGEIDSQGNGQPSIIYKGLITADPGERSKPELIGRTEQYYFTTDIITDLTGIRNAKEVFSEIKVSCFEGTKNIRNPD